MGAVTAAEARLAVVAAVAQGLEEAGIDPEAAPDDLDLIERGIVDSLGLLELIAALEESFGLELDFEGVDPEELTKIGGLSAEVADQSAAATGP